jgi:hypothetical protein
VADGDPGKTRTSDKQFRKLLLYPPELRGHGFSLLKKLRAGNYGRDGFNNGGCPTFV